MLTCKRCGANYPDDASFCNRCNSDLDSDSAANLFDQKEILIERQQRLRAKTQALTSLFILALMFPFLVYFNLVYVATTTMQKIAVLIVVEIATLLAIAGIRKSWRRSRVMCLILAGLLLPLFPAGTVLAFVLIYQLVKRDW